MSELEVCPNCGQTIAEGYLSQAVPVRLKVWFVSITRTVRVLYSSRCGFLKLLVEAAA